MTKSKYSIVEANFSDQERIISLVNEAYWQQQQPFFIDVPALFTFAVSFRSTAKGSSVAFCSSDIAGAMPSSQTTTSDLFRPTEILTVKVNKALS